MVWKGLQKSILQKGLVFSVGVCTVIYVMKITIEINVNPKTGDWSSSTTTRNGRRTTDDDGERGGNVLYDLEDEVTQLIHEELINHGLMTVDGELRGQTFKDSQGTLV
jgi:hypothetical protein